MVCPCCAPGECDCPDECVYQMSASGEGLTVSVSALAVPSECEGCSGISDTDTEANPLDPDEQSGTNELQAYADVGIASFASGFVDLAESYAVFESYGYTYARTAEYAAALNCLKVGDVAVWSLSASISYNESRTEYGENTGVVIKQQSSLAVKQMTADIKVVCPADPVTWNVTVAWDGVTVNGTLYEWDQESGTPLQETCTELVDGVVVNCTDYLQNYMEPAAFVMSRREDCEFP